jgi:hypothetical protein
MNGAIGSNEKIAEARIIRRSFTGYRLSEDRLSDRKPFQDTSIVWQ